MKAPRKVRNKSSISAYVASQKKEVSRTSAQLCVARASTIDNVREGVVDAC